MIGSTTTRSRGESTLSSMFAVEDAPVEEVYSSLDWLLERQPAIERKLAKRHLGDGGMVLYDLSSSYMEGRHLQLAKIGYSRDRKKGTLQVEYGLATDQEGRPVAVGVVPGNTGDPDTVAALVERIKKRFHLKRAILVGDRGMLTGARIEELRQAGGIEWISALRSPQIRALLDSGAIQMGLFDQLGPVEIIHPDYPGERLVVCRNPDLAQERKRKREDLLQATEAKLQPILESVAKGRLQGAAKIAGGASAQPAQGGQALHGRYHRPKPGGPPRSGQDPGRVRARRHLRHPHLGRAGGAGHRPGGAHLQAAEPGGAGFSHLEGPGHSGPAHPPLELGAGQGSHPAVHAGLLRVLAPGAGLGPIAVPRRAAPDPGRPGGSVTALCSRPAQGFHPAA